MIAPSRVGKRSPHGAIRLVVPVLDSDGSNDEVFTAPMTTEAVCVKHHGVEQNRQRTLGTEESTGTE